MTILQGKKDIQRYNTQYTPFKLSSVYPFHNQLVGLDKNEQICVFYDYFAK